MQCNSECMCVVFISPCSCLVPALVRLWSTFDMEGWDEVKSAWNRLRQDETFKAMRGRLFQRTSTVPWRQTLSAHFTAPCGPGKEAPVTSLKDCGLDNVLQDGGGFGVCLFFHSSFVAGDGGSFRFVDVRQVSKKMLRPGLSWMF